MNDYACTYFLWCMALRKTSSYYVIILEITIRHYSLFKIFAQCHFYIIKEKDVPHILSNILKRQDCLPYKVSSRNNFHFASRKVQTQVIHKKNQKNEKLQSISSKFRLFWNFGIIIIFLPVFLKQFCVFSLWAKIF